LKSRYFLVALAVLLLAVLSSFIVSASGDLNCFFHAATTCPAGSAKLIGVQNESGGWMNAHAQNRTLGTYANSVCCNNTNSSITTANSCSGAAIVRLYTEDNSHIQSGNNSDYPIAACISSSYKNITCSYTTSSCAASTTCVLSMASSEGANNTNAHVGNCSAYSLKACCGISNNAPSAPTLAYPINGNTTVFERRVNFTWTNAIDPEGNAVTYTLNATCGSSCTCSAINVGSIAVNYSYSASELCFDKVYNWTVTACDAYNECNTSAKSNFTIASVVDFVFVVNSTDFGSLALGESKQTGVGSGPGPLVGRNNGNVRINGTINATAVFTSAALNTNNYQFYAQDNESGSIVAGCSQTSLTAMNSAPKNIFCNLTHSDTSDEVRVHINLTVPGGEAPGEKNSTIQLTVVSAE
jgi:hypothetical protein